ncbi:MAG TPA: hypothetical protein VMH23_14805 [Bacteroidota bacterium]|nr:hypothetical protein [Bacteroidota bacterium]
MENKTEISQELPSMPANIVLPLNMSYDQEKRILVLTGPLSEAERNKLLRGTEDPVFCHAVELLYRNSQIPDSLEWREGSDDHFVTETLKAMPVWWRVALTLWFIAIGVFSILGLFEIWPGTTSATDQIKSKLDSVLIVQKKQIDSLSAASPQSAKMVKTVQTPSQQKARTPADTSETKEARTNSPASTIVSTDTSGMTIRRMLGVANHELQYLFLALFAGGLGGALRSLSSLVMYRANRRLFTSWILWYFCQPVLGGMFAVVGLAMVKAGFIGGSGVEVLSPSGVVAFSALTGLFIDEFTNKLSEVFKTIFATKSPPAIGGKITPKDPEVAVKK